MIDFLQNLADNTQWPLLTALALGLLTALSPCPLATNIAAVGYVSKNISGTRRAFAGGVMYALGRIAAYSVLGIALIAIIKSGGDTYSLPKYVTRYGENLLPFFLIASGVAILFVHKIKFTGISVGGIASKIKTDLAGSFALGFIFAFAFCPTSAMFFFAMLIPLSATYSFGYALSSVFGASTALPVIIVAVMISYGIGNVGRFYGRMNAFERYFRALIGALFTIIGIYYFTSIYI